MQNKIITQGQVFLTPQQKVLQVKHQEWLTHPITQQLRHILEEHEKKITNTVISISSEYGEFTHLKQANLASQLATLTAVKNLIYDTETFVVKSGSKWRQW